MCSDRLLVVMTSQAGFGRGELSGLVANLRAIMVVIAAPIFAQVSLVGRRNSFPGSPLIAVAM